MPLLICPNDNSGMQTASRSGVEFDFCPTCRGVWLDRGELEKLMGAAHDVAPTPAAAPVSRGYDDRSRHERERRWDDDDYRRKPRRGSSIFDIFD